jgi:hypothetical protein
MARNSGIGIGIGIGLVLAVPITLVAGDVSGLISFSNGTVADADEVNANFAAVKTAVDDNDARLDDLVVGTAVLVGTHSTCDGSLEGLLRWTGSELEVCTNGAFTILARAGATGTITNPGRDCKDILDTLGTAADGLYYVDPDGVGALASRQVYCDMTTDGGGWTLIMELRDDTTFQWSSTHWTTSSVFADGVPDVSTDTNNKYGTFNEVAGTEMMYKRIGQPDFKSFEFGTSETALSHFQTGSNAVSTGGGWRPPESHNNTSNSQCSSFTSAGSGLNYTQSCDAVSQGSRVRLGEGYEQPGVAHCIWGVGTFNNPCSPPTSGFGSRGGRMKLFIR